MNNSKRKPCIPQYSTGNGVAVAQILGGWGLSSCKMSPDHANIRRLKEIFSQMDELKTPRTNMHVIYDRRNDPESWYIPPSPPECRPSWTYAENRPLITFSTSADYKIPIFSFRSVKAELKNPAPGREFFEQGTDKWYKADPMGYCYPNCGAPTKGHSCIRNHHSELSYANTHFFNLK